MLPDSQHRSSCLYTGIVHHRRLEPVRHEFRYRLCLFSFDLDELPNLDDLAPLWGFERRAAVSFRRSDYLGEPTRPLADCVRDLVAVRTGRRPHGPIRLLTQPRIFGYCFNPISLYFCFDSGGNRPECIVAEVTNTPWNERHCYVLPVRDDDRADTLRFDTEKEFHVSPFMGMEMRYQWRISMADERLSVHIGNRNGDGRIFDAGMSLKREDLTRRTLAGALLRYPWMTARIAAAIYVQALRLWWKGTPFFPHPKYRPESATRALAPAEHRR